MAMLIHLEWVNRMAKEKADVKEITEVARSLSDEDRYKVLMMIQGIILVRASEIEMPKKQA